jgi:prevent-host-death family protein
MEVGVRELKNNLSRYLAKVAAGSDVVVTDRGVPVARLSSIVGTGTLERLVAEGVVTLGTEAKQPAPTTRLVADGPVSPFVDEQRR